LTVRLYKSVSSLKREGAEFGFDILLKTRFATILPALVLFLHDI
jgi:hypothetical protein